MKFQLPVFLVSGIVLAFANTAISSAAIAGSVNYSGGFVTVSPDGFGENLTLSVSGPNGLVRQVYSEFGVPSVSIRVNGSVADGVYVWQLTGSAGVDTPMVDNGLDNGRGAAQEKFIQKEMVESGAFRIEGGAFQAPDPKVSE